MSRAWRVMLSALAGTLFITVQAQASPGIRPGSFRAVALNQDGTVDTDAGSHPYEYEVGFELNHDQNSAAEGSVRDVVAELPPGIIGNPTATPRCPRQDFDGETANCPADTQIGTFSAVFRDPSGGTLAPSGPLYNLVPGKGVAASFGFAGEGFDAIENASLVHSPAGYTVSVISNNVSQSYLLSVAETVWGVPADESHDSERECVPAHITPCSTEAAPAPFLTLPTSCDGPLSTLLEVDFADAPGEYLAASYQSPGLVGCEGLDFRPSLLVQPRTSAAASPTGLHVDLRLPQEESTKGRAEAELKNAAVTLPAGMSVNPSSANGLQGCTSVQIELDSTTEARCPEASRIGSVEIDTPLLDHPLPGAVYVAAQGDNPFNGLLAIYIVVDDPISGAIVKLAGHVEPNPQTGQVTTTFANNPQLPFNDLKVDLADGERASLTTPGTCGAYETTSDLTPWTTPAHADATPSSIFQTSSGPHGTACVYSELQEPNHPGFEAGTTVPLAASYSPFVMDLAREDGSQDFEKIEVRLPPGLSGKLAGLSRCSDVQIAAAAAPDHSGAAEIASPSCPAASEVGTVDVAAGAGSQPVHATGHAYIAGPYGGAPFSLAIITPAVAGPFDLGTVVVRAGLYINPETTQVTVRSDPIPTILKGIPLDVRSVLVNISRDQFTLNPTNCERLTLAGLVTSSLGQVATLSHPFQVRGCAGLVFKPSFKVATHAKTSKANGAALKVLVSEKPGEANIHKVDLQLPRALPARLTTLQKACTDAQFAADPAHCPEASIIGTAKAVTPILSSPLTGPAYLVSHGGAAFPDVVFLLQGEGVTIKLVGNTDIKKGLTFSRFEDVPDQPISSFETSLPEGPHSALAANGNLCALPLTLPTTIVAQNGTQIAQKTKISVTGCAKPRVKIRQAKVKHGALTVIFITSQQGGVTLGGKAIRTATRIMSAGLHRIAVPLTRQSKTTFIHHRRTRVKVSLKNANGTTTRIFTIKL